MRSSSAFTCAPELVERILGVAHGDARAQAPRLQDVADGAAQVAQGLEGGARQDVAAAHGDEADEQEGDQQRPAHAGQQLRARGRALAHLEQRAVGQPRGEDLEHRALRRPRTARSTRPPAGRKRATSKSVQPSGM